MAKKDVTYAEALTEIEAILARMNDESLDIDSLAVQVARAGELIKLCRERLRRAEEDVCKALGEK